MSWDSVTQHFATHGDNLRRYLKPTVGSAEAEDLVQATFLRLLERQTAEELNVPWAYIKTAGWRLAYDLKVRNAKSPVIFNSVLVEAHGDQADPMERDPAETLTTVHEIERVRARLRPIYWTVLFLYGQRLSVNEIAKREKLSIHTVKTYLIRAKGAARALKYDTSQHDQQEFPLAVRRCLVGFKAQYQVPRLRIEGETFGQLTVLRFVRSKRGKSIFLCRCSCGNTREVVGSSLKNGSVDSCGCVRRQRMPGVLRRLRTGLRTE